MTKARQFAALMVMAALAPLPAAAAPLEDIIAGNFTATGINRLKPGEPAERVFCRLAGTKTGDATFDLSGRCATANVSGRMQIGLTVTAPGTRYELDVTVAMAKLAGYASSYHYTGTADASGATFVTPFTLDGKQYRSSFRISYGAEGIDRIVETVTAAADGAKTVLVDLKVKRE